MIEGPFTKPPAASHWLWLGTALGAALVIWGLALGAAEADFYATTPARIVPEAQNAPVARFADPCSLEAVVCPDEQPGYVKPAAPEPAENRVIIATVYTYHATPEQTDSDPCTTADGTDICPLPSFGVIANNCLDFGTQVQIGQETYTVHDRMNSRYGCDVFDILTDGTAYTLFNQPVIVL